MLGYEMYGITVRQHQKSIELSIGWWYHSFPIDLNKDILENTPICANRGYFSPQIIQAGGLKIKTNQRKTIPKVLRCILKSRVNSNNQPSAELLFSEKKS